MRENVPRARLLLAPPELSYRNNRAVVFSSSSSPPFRFSRPVFIGPRRAGKERVSVIKLPVDGSDLSVLPARLAAPRETRKEWSARTRGMRN